jgi:hypothetical protein
VTPPAVIENGVAALPISDSIVHAGGDFVFVGGRGRNGIVALD